MTTNQLSTLPKSVFRERGFKTVLEECKEQIQQLYKADHIPWVVGYSGGKDSTAVLQLVWLAIQDLDAGERNKKIHVITTDTLVENPVVASWVRKSLEAIDRAAMEQDLPIRSNILTPATDNTFWVNLIGRGYPAPRPKFRWCTERMKIDPADQFIRDVVAENGEAILVLGTRSAESSVRAHRISRLKENRTRELLSQHPSLTNAFTYTPIEDWSNDDVWMFLMQRKNPWDYDNRDLLTMYKGATADGECPLVIDTKTPSCGDSRFGCWVCTLVDKDRSMSAMIKNDREKSWMAPLLELRNQLDEHDHDKRDFRRMTGQVQLIRDKDKTIPGPYTQASRADWLKRLLRAQEKVRSNPRAPEEVQDLELISMPEMHEIRRIWVIEKHETEDLLPQIYKEETGRDFPAKSLNDNQPFGSVQLAMLREVCGEQDLLFELLRELLDIERAYQARASRAYLFEKIETAFKKHFYDGVDDATERALQKRALNTQIAALSNEEGDFEEELSALKESLSTVKKGSAL